MSESLSSKRASAIEPPDTEAPHARHFCLEVGDLQRSKNLKGLHGLQIGTHQSCTQPLTDEFADKL